MAEAAVKTGRRALLIVRAGNKSLHPFWLSGPGAETRNWDLHISYFGDIADAYSSRPSDVTLTAEKGPKYPGLLLCLEKLGDRIYDYDYVGFPDDDLHGDCATWNRFFDILDEYKPLLAQPALKRGSFFSFQEVLQRPKYLLRWTNFVEVMTPVFAKEALKVCLPTFSENKSGWGIDFLWAERLKRDPSRICVVDGAPLLHTRAVGVSPMYKALLASGDSPRLEKAALLKRHGLEEPSFKAYSALTVDGREIGLTTADAKKPAILAFVQRVQRKIGKHVIGPEPPPVN